MPWLGLRLLDRLFAIKVVPSLYPLNAKVSCLHSTGKGQGFGSADLIYVAVLSSQEFLFFWNKKGSLFCFSSGTWLSLVRFPGKSLKGFVITWHTQATCRSRDWVSVLGNFEVPNVVTKNLGVEQIYSGVRCVCHQHFVCLRGVL